MKKKFNSVFIFLFILLIIIAACLSNLNMDIMAESIDDNDLYAISACLMDADSNRVLYGKNCDEIRPMASTTKIMTLILTLELADLTDIVEISPYAASMPDVQLNITAGEKYKLKDLLYAMMLESYNDVAVAIAEHVGEKYLIKTNSLSKTEQNNENDYLQNSEKKSRSFDESKKYVLLFCDAMNQKAEKLNCTNTHFVTPNGLDGEDEGGKHATTAKELAIIASYCIKNKDFNEIVGTKKYSFYEINKNRHIEVYNKDAFLNQMPGAFGIKTGFTGEAGYCFVGALKSDERTFISVVLGSGWPNNRTYKWKDTKKLMQYGINNYQYIEIFNGIKKFKTIYVIDGKSDYISTSVNGNIGMLLCQSDEVNIKHELKEFIYAPVDEGDVVGKTLVYVNEELVAEFPIISLDKVEKIDFKWFLEKVIRAL